MSTLDFATPAHAKVGWDRPTYMPGNLASQEVKIQAGLPESVSDLMCPDDVVNDPGMTEAEKRAILASWISDVRAVIDAPAFVNRH